MTDFQDHFAGNRAAGAPAGAPDAPPPLSLGDRIVKVFVAPTVAMREIAVRPAWLVPLGLVWLLVWLYTAANLHIILPEQTERQIAHAPDAQVEMLYQQLDMFSDPPAWLRVLMGLGSGLSAAVFAILLPGLILHLFLRLSEGAGTARQTLGVVCWAGLIAYGLRTLLSWIIVAVTGSGVHAGLTAASLMPAGNPASLGHVIANLYGDPFVYWMLWVILLGVMQVHRLAFNRALTVIVATYVLLSAVPIGFTLLGQVIGAR
jgi:hypothetical protein